MTAAILLELAWKSGLLAAAALLGAALLRTRPAAERVLVLRLGVVMIASLPLAAALLPALQVEAPAFVVPAPRTAPVVAGPVGLERELAGSPVEAAGLPTLSRPAAAPAWRPEPGLALITVWALGASLLLLRLGTGVAMLHRWTRRAAPVSDARWLAALDRAAPQGRRPLLRASSKVASPLSWGVRPAVILLNPEALEQAARADAVLTHEMGHVRHADWLFLMLMRGLVALLWFNPLIWLLQRELAHQSEQAADAWALRRIGRVDYASALVAMAARARPHAALGMAAPKGELARRITAIMQGPTGRRRPWPAALTIAGCVGLATPLAALELAPRTVSAEAAPTARPTLPQGPGTIAPSPSTSGAIADAGGSGATRAMDVVDRTDERAPEMKEQRINTVKIEADSIQVDANGAVEAAGTGLQINASGAVRVSTGPRIDAPVAVQIPSDPPVPPQAWAAHAAEQRADAEAAMREGARQRVAGMREGARQLRQGAVEMEMGAMETERSAATTTDPDRRRNILDRADNLRRQAGDLRRQADAMEASIGPDADP